MNVNFSNIFVFSKKFRSANEVYLHACAVHCPDNIDVNAEIYCQWGPGPNLCDNLPRKRFSLMTHLLDRHCSPDAFKAAVARRVASGPTPQSAAGPVTMIKNPAVAAPQVDHIAGTASPALSTTSSGSAGSAALQAIKRHSIDFVSPKEMMVSGADINIINVFNTDKYCYCIFHRTRTRVPLQRVFVSQPP